MRRTHVAVIAGALGMGALVGLRPVSSTAQQAGDRTQAAAAQAPAAAAENAEQPPVTTLKLYDVSDLTRGVLPFKMPSDVLPPSLLHFRNDQRAWNGLFCGQKREDADVERLEPIEITQIIQLIEPMQPQPFSAGEIGGMLAIEAEATAHKRVEQVLQQLRAARPLGRSVEVRAHWVFVEPGKLSTLYREGTRQIDPQKLLSQPGVLYAQAAARTITGQAVTLVSGRARTIMLDQEPSVGQATAAYDPDVVQILSGLLATVDLRVMGREAMAWVAAGAGDWDEPGQPSKLMSIGGSAATEATMYVPPAEKDQGRHVEVPLPIPSPSARTVAEVDRLNMLTMQLHTTLKLPLGKPTLVGGMTLEPATGATSAKGDPRQLYLILEVDLAEDGAGDAKQ